MTNQGNFAAYQQVTPYDDSVSQDIKYWEQDAAKKRQEARDIQGLEDEKKQKAQADKQAMYDKYIKPLNNYDSGSKSLNEFNARIIKNATKEYLPLIQTLEDPNASEETRIQAQIKLQNIHKLPENLKAVTDNYTKQWNEYEEAVSNGTAWKNPQLEQLFQDGFSSFQGGVDEYGMPIIAFADLNKDNDNDFLAVQPFEEISKGVPLFNFQQKHNPEALAKNLADSLGTTDETTVDGYDSLRVKAVREEDLNTRADKLFFGDDKTATSVARDAVKRLGINPDDATEEDFNKVRDQFKDLTKTFLPEISTEKTDNSAKNAAVSNSLKAQKQNQDQPTLTEVVEPSEQTWGNKILEIKSKNGGLSNVKIGAIKGIEETVSDAVVKNYAFNGSGDMLVDVEVVKTKAVSETEYKELEKEKQEGSLNADMIIQVALMAEQKPGSRRISLPGTKEKKVLAVSREDQADIARQAGTTIEEMEKNVGFERNDNDSKPFNAEEFYKNHKSKRN